MTTSPPRALILAAGRGERMRPLTDHTPKPLLQVHGKPLIEWHLQALARDGIREVVINTAWLEAQFPAALGDGSRFGLSIRYSMEGRDHGGALETAGGIAKALPWLAPRGDEVFWVVSGDIHVPDFRYDPALVRTFEAGEDHALIWTVPNPSFKHEGDFAIDAAGRLTRPAAALRSETYANIALARRALVATVRPGERAALGPLLFEAADRGRLAGRRLEGAWANLGTAEQLGLLRTHSRSVQ
jgi:N-acetyl-alpha-D-muramate 1-phosphate uridylyltransferase